MEFTKLRGFWKTKTSKLSDVIVDLEGAAQLDCANKSNAKTTSTNNNENVFTISQKTKENTLSCKQISKVVFVRVKQEYGLGYNFVYDFEFSFLSL